MFFVLAVEFFWIPQSPKPREIPMLEGFLPEGLWPFEGTHTAAVHYELQPWEGLTLEKLIECCLLWEKPTLEQVKSVRTPPPEKEGAAEKSVMK